MIHSSYFRPKIFSIDGDVDPANIDRLQELTSSTTLNREKIQEVGRDGIVDWRKNTPDITVSGRQLEYGQLGFYRKMAGKTDAVSTILWSDLSTKRFDIAGYKTDDSGTFLGTVWYPKLRLAGFTINFGGPEAIIERSFNFVGEDDVVLQQGNKYLIHKRFAISAGLNQTCSLSNPTPAADPDNSGQYLLRVVRIRSGVATILTHGLEWSYNGAGTLVINGTSIAGDVIKVWYSAATYISGEDPFTANDTDLASIDCRAVSLYLASSNYLYRLQSASMEVAYDRFDVMELGNDETVAYGVRDITTRVTLGRIIEAYTIEEVLRGKAGLSYGKLDVRNYTTDLNLIAKIYSDENKGTFKLGYKCTDLSPVGADAGTPTDDYITRGVSLEGEIGFVTTVNGIL